MTAAAPARVPALRRLRTRRQQALTRFRPGPAFERFVADESPKVLCRAANGAGKTQHAAYKLAIKAVRQRIRARWLGPTSAQVRDVAGRYLAEFLGPYLAPGCRYTPGVGFNRNNTIELANGSQIQLRSYQDEIDGQAGDSLDVVVFDEVPPYGHWEENIGRVGRTADSMGQAWLLFTAVNRPSAWVRKEVEGPDPSPSALKGWERVEHTTGWVQYVVPLRLEYCPWHTAESFEAYASKWRGKDTEAQRLHAAWEGSVQLRRLGAFTSSSVVPLAWLQKQPWDEFRLGIDHGKGFGKQYACITGVQHDSRAPRFGLLAEYVGDGDTTPITDARGILGMISSLGLSVWDIDAAFGDIGMGGRTDVGEGGGKWNQMIERAIAELLGMTVGPWPIVVPYKKRKTPQAGEAAMNHAFKESRFWVSATCPHWARCAMQYVEGAEDLKDPIDGSRYSIQDLLLGARAERTHEWVAT